MQLEKESNPDLQVFLSPEATLHGKQLEKLSFKAVGRVPLPNQRVLTALEVALEKIDLVAVMPQLCHRLWAGDGKLENILGTDCSQALLELRSFQMAWLESKNGKGSKSNWSNNMMTVTETSQGGDSNGEGYSDTTRTKISQSTSISPTHSHNREVGAGSKICTGGTGTGVRSLKVSKVSILSADTQAERKEEKNISEHKGKREGDGTSITKNAEDAVAVLRKDISKVNFLWDVINAGKGRTKTERVDAFPPATATHIRDSRPMDSATAEIGEEGEQVDEDHAYSYVPMSNRPELEASTSTSLQSHNMVQLIKQALRGKYSDHTRRCLKDKDVKSLLCILSLIDPTNHFPENDNNKVSINGTSSASPIPTAHSLELENDHLKHVRLPLLLEDSEETEESSLKMTSGYALDVVDELEDNITDRQSILHSQSEASSQSEPSSQTSSSSSSSQSALIQSQSHSHSIDEHYERQGVLYLGEMLDSYSSDSESEEEEEDEKTVFSINKETEDTDVEVDHSRESSVTKKIVKIPLLEESSGSTDTSTESSLSQKNSELDEACLTLVDSRERISPSLASISLNKNKSTLRLFLQQTEEDSLGVNELKSSTSFEKNLSLEKIEEPEADTMVNLLRNQRDPIMEPTSSKNIDNRKSIVESAAELPLYTHTRSFSKFNGATGRCKTLFPIPPISSDEYLREAIKRRYSKVLELLTNNDSAMKWIKNNPDIRQVTPAPQVVKMTESPSYSSNSSAKAQEYYYGPSKELEKFREEFYSLYKLMKERMSLSFEERMSNEASLGKLRIKVQDSLKVQQNLEKELSELESIQKSKLAVLDAEIENLQAQLELELHNNERKVKSVVKEGEILHLINKKAGNEKLWEVREELRLAQESRDTSIKKHSSAEGKMRKRKSELEEDLKNITENYDTNMMTRQKILDDLEVDIRINEEKIQELQTAYEATEESYNEMKQTKRLRELLKSIELADSYKKTWAAKRIQEAWRKYKAMRFRRQRRGRKGGGLRKKSSRKLEGTGDGKQKTKKSVKNKTSESESSPDMRSASMSKSGSATLTNKNSVVTNRSTSAASSSKEKDIKAGRTIKKSASISGNKSSTSNTTISVKSIKQSNKNPAEAKGKKANNMDSKGKITKKK